MGREVRQIPKDWQHPKGKVSWSNEPEHIPLFDGYDAALSEWEETKKEWDTEIRKSEEYMFSAMLKHKADGGTFEDWHGEKPRLYSEFPEIGSYVPDWPSKERTHYQMYETTSEGSPISPVMESPEALARWLTDHEASSLADRTATYEQWLRICGGGHAPTMIGTIKDEKREIQSGVEGVKAKDR